MHDNVTSPYCSMLGVSHCAKSAVFCCQNSSKLESNKKKLAAQHSHVTSPRPLLRLALESQERTAKDRTHFRTMSNEYHESMSTN